MVLEAKYDRSRATFQPGDKQTPETQNPDVMAAQLERLSDSFNVAKQQFAGWALAILFSAVVTWLTMLDRDVRGLKSTDAVQSQRIASTETSVATLAEITSRTLVSLAEVKTQVTGLQTSINQLHMQIERLSERLYEARGKQNASVPENVTTPAL